MKKLELADRISWVSTLDFYPFINEWVNQQLRGRNFAKRMICSLNLNGLQRNNAAGNWEATYKLIAGAWERLKRSGAQALVPRAGAACLVAGRVEQRIGLPVIHIEIPA